MSHLRRMTYVLKRLYRYIGRSGDGRRLGLLHHDGARSWPSRGTLSAHLPGMLTAAVYLTGEWTGAVMHSCGAAPRPASSPAHSWGCPRPMTLVDDDVRDVMGELANMIAGNLKCTLAPGIRVSMPSVTDGPGYSLRVCGAHVVFAADSASDAGPFWVSLIDAGEAQLRRRIDAPDHPEERVDHHRGHAHRNRDFPADVHELIVAEAREGAAEPDHHVDDASRP